MRAMRAWLNCSGGAPSAGLKTVPLISTSLPPVPGGPKGVARFGAVGEFSEACRGVALKGFPFGAVGGYPAPLCMDPVIATILGGLTAGLAGALGATWAARRAYRAAVESATVSAQAHYSCGGDGGRGSRARGADQRGVG